jgi:hypothetical protein
MADDIRKAFHAAIDILDASETQLRLDIESDLFNVAGLNSTKLNLTQKALDGLLPKIEATRTKAIKNAFRYLKSALPAQTIYGRTLADWARGILGQDLKRIESVIKMGLIAQDENTTIAHRVIGSRSMQGRNGATEITRQHIYQLGRGCVHEAKTRMGGSTADVPALQLETTT